MLHTASGSQGGDPAAPPSGEAADAAAPRASVAVPGSGDVDRPPRLRTVDPLVLEVTGGRITVSSPRLRRRLVVGRSVAALLLAARDGLPPDTRTPAATLTALTEAGFLVDADEPPQPPAAPWRDWGPLAWSFHTHTRDVPFLSAEPTALAAYRERIETRPRPSGVRAAASDRVLLLPRVRSALDVPFRSVLETRRTHRTFVAHELALDPFADLLHYSFAPLRFADAGPMGVLHLRASASGGARHETEAFVGVFSVAGVEPGLYHYDNIRHGLVPVRGDVGRAEFEHLTNGQGFFGQAAFGVLTVAVADRMSWKYVHPHAYRMLLHDVGHVAQVFSMTATALGLGAALTGALRNTEADTLLGLDRPREFTTFALACGLPLRGPDGLPAKVRTPRTAPDHL
ncbi:MAG TPA: SagB/ThcOx family dehydrogenase [Pilimelia sp.]|nr:SagB/ThcOx family dehydrogenase [Pilimelia sp.]